MKPLLLLRRSAREDVRAAAHWYNNQRSGLGYRFLDELGELLLRVEENPRQFPIILEEVRRGLLRRFPYGVYFVPHQERIEVIAVLHLHRNPRVWMRREQESL